MYIIPIRQFSILYTLQGLCYIVFQKKNSLDLHRPMRNYLCASRHDRLVDRRACFQQARPVTNVADNTIDLPWQNFRSPEFRANFARNYRYLWRRPNFLITQRRIGERKPVYRKRASSIQTVVWIQQWTVTDRRTDTERHRHRATAIQYRARIASRVKNTSSQIFT